MKPAPFDYVRPQTLESALAELARHGPDARPLAGGQSLVPMLALRLARPALLVDLNRIPALAGVEECHDEFRIGAMTRQAHVLAAPAIRRRLPLIAAALRFVGHPPTRARGTIGGSLAHADPAAELPAVMVALEARMVLSGPGGRREVGADSFFRGMFATDAGTGELLTAIRVPANQPGGAGFAEIARRYGDFALVAAAARIVCDAAGRCIVARLVLGAVASIPVRCAAAESALLGRRPDARAIAEAAGLLPLEAVEFDTHGAGRAWRQQVAMVLARRALAQAAAGAA